MPRLIIGDAFDGTIGSPENAYLRWWHIPVTIEKRLFSYDTLINCSVFLVTPQFRIQLGWRRGMAREPTEFETLRVGDNEVIIPLFVRLDRAGGAVISASPSRLPRFPLDSFVARITHLVTMFEARDMRDLPTGRSNIRIEVQSGRNIIPGREMTVNVPPVNSSNFEFTIVVPPPN